nr:MAG TPA: hypothetical protein [Caudoviricetes sp.]
MERFSASPRGYKRAQRNVLTEYLRPLERN